MKSVEYWTEHLGLQPHPEGGFYTETYRSNDDIGTTGLPNRFSGNRSASTGIYFLLRGQDISHFHKIKSDEMWHFYTGSPLTVHMINGDGNYSALSIGPDPDSGHRFQAVVPAGVWFGATVDDPNSYALVGCTVAPGFDFEDFELATRAKLLSDFPEHAEIIQKMTPEKD